jgi:cytochrome d ubiquinol oxidase subunit I
VNPDPIAGMLNPAAFPQTLHMTLAAYAATGFAVAGIHALRLLREPGNGFHRRALQVALWVGAPAALLLPLSGDVSARHVAQWQPVKLAALEGQFKTERGAPLRIGGWPDEAAGETRYALEIPRGLSLLAFHDPSAEVKGLEAFPRSDWPPVLPVHLGFQIMVGLGSFMALVAAWTLALMARRRDLVGHRWLLRALVAAAPTGFICVEAGWVVTEVGRQPWVIQGVLRTAEAVTPMPGLVIPFVTFTLLYCFLGVVVAWLLYQQVLRSPTTAETAMPVSVRAGVAG